MISVLTTILLLPVLSGQIEVQSDHQRVLIDGHRYERVEPGAPLYLHIERLRGQRLILDIVRLEGPSPTKVRLKIGRKRRTLRLKADTIAEKYFGRRTSFPVRYRYAVPRSGDVEVAADLKSAPYGVLVSARLAKRKKSRARKLELTPLPQKEKISLTPIPKKRTKKRVSQRSSRAKKSKKARRGRKRRRSKRASKDKTKSSAETATNDIGTTEQAPRALVSSVAPASTAQNAAPTSSDDHDNATDADQKQDDDPNRTEAAEDTSAAIAAAPTYVNQPPPERIVIAAPEKSSAPKTRAPEKIPGPPVVEPIEDYVDAADTRSGSLHVQILPGVAIQPVGGLGWVRTSVGLRVTAGGGDKYFSRLAFGLGGDIDYDEHETQNRRFLYVGGRMRLALDVLVLDVDFLGTAFKAGAGIGAGFTLGQILVQQGGLEPKTDLVIGPSFRLAPFVGVDVGPGAITLSGTLDIAYDGRGVNGVFAPLSFSPLLGYRFDL